jgi:hypothetical protein
MTKNEIILIADASGISFYGMGKDRDKFLHYLEAFATLVAAHKAEVALAEAYRCGVLAGAEAEREACAKLVDHILKEGGGNYGDAIRARGEKA